MLSDKAREEIVKSLNKYPNMKSAVMDALRVAQAEKGHVTKEDMEEIARILEIEPVEVNASAGFYSMYRVEKPTGKYHIQVCRNLSCSLLGAEHIIEHIGRKLGIETGSTTSDKLFTLSTVECLGSCGTAPMMQINDDYYENLTPERVDEIIDEFKKQP